MAIAVGEEAREEDAVVIVPPLLLLDLQLRLEKLPPRRTQTTPLIILLSSLRLAMG